MITQATHAPGPWTLSLTDDTTVLDADRREVCTASGDYDAEDEWPVMEANAKLIAAAPRLLSALRNLLVIAGTPITERQEAVFAEARETLAAATV